MEEPPTKLSWTQRLCFSIGHVQNDVCASMWFTYLLIFFQMVLGWPPHVAGLVMLIGQVADAISTPFVGLQADLKDRSVLCQYGRRKIWHLVGSLCVVLSFPFIFSPCVGCRNAPGDYWVQLFYYGAFVCIFQFGWASVQISHLSLIPHLTPDTHARTGLIACRYSFTVVSNVLVYCITWAVFHITNSSDSAPIGPSDVSSFQHIVAVGLGVGILCSALFHVIVKEPQESSESNVQRDANDGAPPTNQKTAAEQMGSIKLYQIAGVYMATRLFANLSQVYTPLYLHEQGLGAESLAIVPLVMFLSSFSTSLIAKPINSFLGRKGAYVIGCLIGLGGCIWVWLGAGTIYTTYEVHAVAILLGASSSIQLVTSLGLTADLIGTNTNTGAFVYGCMSFVDKLSNGVAVVLLQAYFHHNYRNVLAFVCGGAVVLGLLCVATLVRCKLRSSSGSNEEDRSEREHLCPNLSDINGVEQTIR